MLGPANFSRQPDFGNDAYLDLADGWELTGNCVAIQVGRAHSLRTGQWIYFGACEAYRPRVLCAVEYQVIGVAYDDETDELFWFDFTAELRPQDL